MSFTIADGVVLFCLKAEAPPAIHFPPLQAIYGGEAICGHFYVFPIFSHFPTYYKQVNRFFDLAVNVRQMSRRFDVQSSAFGSIWIENGRVGSTYVHFTYKNDWWCKTSPKSRVRVGKMTHGGWFPSPRKNCFLSKRGYESLGDQILNQKQIPWNCDIFHMIFEWRGA